MPLKLKRYPEKSPYWYVRGTEAGISIFESTGTVERKEAEAYRKKRRRELYASGALGEQQPKTFADAMSAYLLHGGEERFLDPLLEHFKEKPLTEIGQSEIDQCAHSLYSGRKASTLNRQVYGPMIAVMRHAAKPSVFGSPMPAVQMLKAEKVPPVWTTDAYIRALVALCKPRLAAFVMVMTTTGLRASEMLRQEPADYALREGWVHIGKTKIGEPAFVPLAPLVWQSVMAIMPKEGRVFGYTTVQGVNKALRAATHEKLPYYSTHKIGRHTFAARLFSDGADIKAVKEAGRWKKLATVDEIYGHLEKRQTHDMMISAGIRAFSVELKLAVVGKKGKDQ